MWNFLIVIIIALIIWMLNPLTFFKQSAGVDKKTKTEVNSVLDDTTKQVDKARQLQKEEQKTLDN